MREEISSQQSIPDFVSEIIEIGKGISWDNFEHIDKFYFSEIIDYPASNRRTAVYKREA